MSLTNIIDYSIIICTYNPDEVIFKRCLAAVAALEAGDFSMEIIVVDNNSSISLSELEYVKSFLRNVPNSRMIKVIEQGLSYARMGGILESKGEQIVFFDDDNEPDVMYLRELNHLNKNYPTVAAWGPGVVNVDFLSNVNPRLLNLAKEAYQDRHETSIAYSNQHSWQDCYPFGTGLAIRRQLCLGYIDGVKAGTFTLSDRKGNELTSGGDTQMVLFSVSKGWAAGVAPNMSLTHMVPAKRITWPYLSSLTYGTNLCYSTCVLEVFPEEMSTVSSFLVKPNKFRVRVLKKMFLLLFDHRVKKKTALIDYIGFVSGAYLALKMPVPSISFWALRRLKVN